MKITLTNRQKEIIKNTIGKGYITIDELRMYYATGQSRTEFLARLSMAGYIKEDKIPGKFVFTEKSKELEI